MVKINSISDAIRIAQEIERYEIALKEMKDELKRFVQENGPVDTGHKTWDFSLSVSWVFSPDKLKELASEILMNGGNPWEYLGIGSREISSLKKAGIVNDSVLQKYGTEKIAKRFGSRTNNTAKAV